MVGASGVRTEPGNLLRADDNAVVIPVEIADRAADAARAVIAEEASPIHLCRGEDRSLEELGRWIGVLDEHDGVSP